MCGRFGLEFDDDFYPRFSIKNLLHGINSRYNIAPSQTTPVIINIDGQNIAEIMRWGLVPSWAKDETYGNRMINGRVETIAEKPTFKKAFESRRCIVPATNFYEWKKEGKSKIPFNIQLKSGKYMALAGLYETWKQSSGDVLKSFTIITTEPNTILKPIHDRMPVILDKDEESHWLDKDFDEDYLLDLARSAPKAMLDVFEISKDINNPENDSKGLINRGV